MTASSCVVRAEVKLGQSEVIPSSKRFEVRRSFCQTELFCIMIFIHSMFTYFLLMNFDECCSCSCSLLLFSNEMIVFMLIASKLLFSSAFIPFPSTLYPRPSLPISPIPRPAIVYTRCLVLPMFTVLPLFIEITVEGTGG